MFRRLFSFLLICVLAALPAMGARAQGAAMPGFAKLPPGARVVLMPMDVELFSISAGGILEPQAEWTQAAVRFLKDAYLGRKEDLKVDFSELDESADETIEDLNRLHGAVGAAINIHHLGMFKLPTKEVKLDWTLGAEVAALKARTGADYALFTFVRDSYATGERVAAMVVAALFGVVLGGGIQAAYVSLVDLSSGQIVWFNRLIRASGDLREAEKARESLNALLAGFPK